MPAPLALLVGCKAFAKGSYKDGNISGPPRKLGFHNVRFIPIGAKYEQIPIDYCCKFFFSNIISGFSDCIGY